MQSTWNAEPGDTGRPEPASEPILHDPSYCEAAGRPRLYRQPGTLNCQVSTDTEETSTEPSKVANNGKRKRTETKGPGCPRGPRRLCRALPAKVRPSHSRRIHRPTSSDADNGREASKADRITSDIAAFASEEAVESLNPVDALEAVEPVEALDRAESRQKRKK